MAIYYLYCIMEFLKNIVSSTIGTVIGLLFAGIYLIFIFVGALIGGIFGAIDDMESDSFEIVNADANVISLSLNERNY